MCISMVHSSLNNEALIRIVDSCLSSAGTDESLELRCESGLYRYLGLRWLMRRRDSLPNWLYGSRSISEQAVGIVD